MSWWLRVLAAFTEDPSTHMAAPVGATCHPSFGGFDAILCLPQVPGAHMLQ